MIRHPALVALLAFAVAGCGAPAKRSPAPRNVLLITIDTIRADRVGAYGYARARTPTLDALASNGVVFDRAYAAAPITLPSHATILTGRYPPGHGSRDNGMPVSPSIPTLATELKGRGFRTAAFVAAFPLDHQFGLARGFDVYSDRLPRQADGRPSNERPASVVSDEALAWLHANAGARTSNPEPFFLWVHLFEPHAPYAGDLTRPVADRYDDEIATVDREIGRLLTSLGPAHADTLTVVAGDHGEAFGEHGEYAHSIFVYDVTLRVPLIVARPGDVAGTGRRVVEPVTLADVAPTIMRALGFELKDVDGIDLGVMERAGSSRAAPPARELYAESMAPLIEFGWAPLRTIRSRGLKYIAAPRPELYDVEADRGEQRDLVGSRTDDVRRLAARVERYSPADAAPVTGASGPDSAAAERLRALGYSAQSAIANPQSIRNPQSAIRNLDRPDPKDRRLLAARIAQVTSGELTGAALLEALQGIVRDDPQNGQAHLRLGYALLQTGRCQPAEREFAATLGAGLRTADAYLGLATCQGRRHDLDAAAHSLDEARRLEPDNPVIVANLGILKASQGDVNGAIASLQAAVAADPDLHEARFNLALALARAGRRAEAQTAARALLDRLSPAAPQRSEVERLIKTLQKSK